MTALCEDLKANTERIVKLWEHGVEQEPWILPRQLARPDFVPELVASIAEATLCLPPSRPSLIALATTAARHARGRAAEGTDHTRVVLEYYFLRGAIWAYFRERRDAADADLRAILFVDVAISIATRAALMGYYRREFDARGTWPGILERLVDETPLLAGQLPSLVPEAEAR